MQTLLDSIHLTKEKMLDQHSEKMNNEDHLSAVGNLNASDEITARPDDPSSVFTSPAESKRMITLQL
ncbi:MAG: hypothetical protein KAQ62_13595 [Cyclobacteriaceae bacterium]|nr:hypothetical protein [Cyclobacteriaceae bacterium]